MHSILPVVLAAAAAAATDLPDPPTLAIPAIATGTSARASPDALGGRVLDREALIARVLERNPSLGAAQAALRAAQARVPQVTSLEDPRVSYSAAPLSFLDATPDGHVVQISQMLPFPGKLALAGDEAGAEARAAAAALEQTRLELALAATRLYDQWFTVHRALEINSDHQELIRTFKRSAQAQYVTGAASQQDPIQAEVELAHLEHQAVVLGADRDVVRTGINDLLHLPAEAGLPPPPEVLSIPEDAPAGNGALADVAVRQRPELAALRARLGGAQAAIALARKRYWPDFMVMGQYNSMWGMLAHRWMVGIGINVPLYWDRREAAVDEAEARAEKLKLEEQRLLDRVGAEVETARLRLVEALHVARLYRTRLVPAAEDQVNAARAGFVVAKTSFNTLVTAEKNLRSVQLALAQSLADADRRRAELDRALGQLPTVPVAGVGPAHSPGENR